jgi:lysophospholipase L1-like esterase
VNRRNALVAAAALALGAALTVAAIQWSKQSSTGAPAAWDYVALGDSLTTGGGLVAESDAYPAQFGRFVTVDTRRRVKVHNLGQNGATSADLLRFVRTLRVRRSLKAAEIVTVDIGANDLGGDVIQPYAEHRCGGDDNEDCLRAMVSRFRVNLDAILDELAALVDARHKIVRVLDLYDNAVGNAELIAFLGPGAEALSKKYTQALDEQTCASAQAHGLLCGDVYHAFNGPTGLDNLFTKGLLADFDHPSVKGHALIAEVLRGLGYAPLRPS